MKKSDKEIALFYGTDAIVDIAIEEMGELIQALIKYKRVTRARAIPTNKSKVEILDNIAEEIADVRISVDEVEYLLGLDDRVKEWGKYKKKRERKRMKEQEVKENDA